jgi:outer membrane protein TolC
MRSAILSAILFGGLLGIPATAQRQLPPVVFESVPEGTAAAGAISLSISDAIDRALRYNLGMITSETETRVARAQHLRAFSDLLPNVRAGVTETIQQVNLAAFGFGGFPGTPPLVGPFSVFDARVRLSSPVIDRRLVHELRRETQELAASNLGQQDTRELVVLVTTDLYLEALATTSRVETARSQLQSAQAVYERSVNLKDAGVVAGIDVVRAQVQQQRQQQHLVAVQNEMAKQMLTLARAIGLPLDQQFTLADRLTATSVEMPAFAEALTAATNSRKDYQRTLALIRAEEESLKAASGRRLPTVAFNADYGDIGRTIGRSHGTFTMQGSVSVPLFEGGRTKSEVDAAQARLDQRRAESDSLRSRIEYEIRTAYLDLESSTQQVQVAESATMLAAQQLVQAQDRFAAGVTNSLEVVQAQEAVTASNESYISSLYSLNVARAMLARAMGGAEQMIKAFLGGR